MEVKQPRSRTSEPLQQECLKVTFLLLQAFPSPVADLILQLTKCSGERKALTSTAPWPGGADGRLELEILPCMVWSGAGDPSPE